MRRRGDNCIDDGGDGGSDVRVAVIATAAMEVAVAMVTATQRRLGTMDNNNTTTNMTTNTTITR
jgi:hypothetical protein